MIHDILKINVIYTLYFHLDTFVYFNIYFQIYYHVFYMEISTVFSIYFLYILSIFSMYSLYFPHVFLHILHIFFIHSLCNLHTCAIWKYRNIPARQRYLGSTALFSILLRNRILPWDLIKKLLKFCNNGRNVHSSTPSKSFGKITKSSPSLHTNCSCQKQEGKDAQLRTSLPGKIFNNKLRGEANCLPWMWFSFGS